MAIFIKLTNSLEFVSLLKIVKYEKSQHIIWAQMNHKSFSVTFIIVCASASVMLQ